MGVERPTAGAADHVIALTPLAAGDLGGALARALRDPSLEIVYWLPERKTFADLDGRPVRPPSAHGEITATMILDSTSEPIAVLLHDVALLHEAEHVQAVCSAAGLALESARQQVELRARLAEVTGSRTRIVESAHELRERDYGVKRVTLEAQGPADTIAGLLRQAPLSENARIAGAACGVPPVATTAPAWPRPASDGHEKRSASLAFIRAPGIFALRYNSPCGIAPRSVGVPAQQQWLAVVNRTPSIRVSTNPA